MKLALYVEGPTEEALPAFFKRWLDPMLPQRVGIHPVVFEGASDYLRHFAGRVTQDLRKGNISGAIGVIDFYGSGLRYPDGSLNQKYAWAKRQLDERVTHPRFIQHFAVHETEAWLLSDPSVFPKSIIGELPKTEQPETINSINPPGHLLKDLYWRKLQKKYKKPIEGASLFRALNPDMAYARCPYLRLLLDDLLALAKNV